MNSSIAPETGLVITLTTTEADDIFRITSVAAGARRNYRAELGFTRRRNTNREDFVINYDSEPKPDGKLVSWRYSHNVGINFDWQGRSQAWNTTSQFTINLQRETSLTFGYSHGYERLFEAEFGPVGTFLDHPERSSPRQSVIFNAETTPSEEVLDGF